MDADLRKARNALDALLRRLPDELSALYTSIDCEALLTQLVETEAPAPAWLADKARTLRLKARLLHAAISDLELRLGSAVEAYRTAGGDDALRLAHAEADRAMLRMRQEALSQRQADAEQLVKAAVLAEQQEDAAALLCSPLLQSLRKSSEGTDRK